jgi:hypothetical protein
MRVKRLDEILEECIAAGLQDGRSVEASLALHPEVAGELEPLLRTALSIAGTYHSYTPPAAVEQRIRTRFLADAAARRRLRELTGDIKERRGWLAGIWSKPVFGGFAAAAAVAVVAVALAVGSIGGSGENAGEPSDPAAVSNLAAQVESVQQKLDNGGLIETTDLEELSALIAALKNSSSDEDLQALRDQLEGPLHDTFVLLTGGSDVLPDAADNQDVQDAIETTRDIAGLIDVNLPGAVVSSDRTPGPTPAASDAPTAAPSDQPTAPPTGNPTPAATPTPAPTAAPTPAPTTENRQPPGFLP